MTEARTGARAFVEQLLSAGVRWLFGNPGTTEQALIDELQDHSEIDLVLALHEGVAVAAAEGYARASGTVAAVQLHAGPGLGNGLGMLYNARAGQTPLVVYVGQSEQRTLYQEPTLSTDFVALAAPIAKWAYEIRTAEEIPQVLRRAFKVAATPPRGPVVISVPMDVMESPCTAPVVPPSWIPLGVRPDPDSIRRATELIATATAPAIVVGDGVATEAGIAAVSALAHLIGAPIFGGSMSAVSVAPDDLLRAQRLPFEADGTDVMLAEFDAVIAIGTKVFAQLFPKPGSPLGDRPVVHLGSDTWELGKNQPSLIVFGDERLGTEDLVSALQGGGVDRLGQWAERRTRVIGRLDQRLRPTPPATGIAERTGAHMSVDAAVSTMAAALPADHYLVDETISAYAVVARHFRQLPGHWFRGRGGGIGGGMAMPVGVQLAHPEGTVVCLTGDGSAMYSITALWTAAHHHLPVVWVILDNRSYRLLKLNTLKYSRTGRPAGRDFIGADLTDPELDFVAIARGMGVEAERVTMLDEIEPALKRAVARRDGPSLVQVMVSGEVVEPSR